MVNRLKGSREFPISPNFGRYCHARKPAAALSTVGTKKARPDFSEQAACHHHCCAAKRHDTRASAQRDEPTPQMPQVALSARGDLPRRTLRRWLKLDSTQKSPDSIGGATIRARGWEAAGWKRLLGSRPEFNAVICAACGAGQVAAVLCGKARTAVRGRSQSEAGLICLTDPLCSNHFTCRRRLDSAAVEMPGSMADDG